MAVSSTNNNGSATSMIDVSAIVDQLMKVENKPLDRLVSRIDQQKLVISDLGTIKSKVAAFQDALSSFENPLSFNTVNASSSNNSVLSVKGSTGAAKGSYSVIVDQLAQASNYSLNGFDDKTDNLDLDSSFKLWVGSESFTWPSGRTATLNNFVNWVNSLGKDVAARIIQTDTSSALYALQLYGTKSGKTNEVAFEGLGIYSSNTAPDENFKSILAQDSEFTVNGVNYVRSSNEINQVIDGVTLNLIGESNNPIKVTVSRGEDNSEEVIKKLIEAYNDLMTTYKGMTATSFNSDKPGNFANNPTLLSFVSEIKSRFSQGITFGSDLIAPATALVNFKKLNSGETLTLGGLTFAAGLLGASAAQVASAFSGLSIGDSADAINESKNLGDSAGGTFLVGSLSGWKTEINLGSTLTFISTTTQIRDTSLKATGVNEPTISYSGFEGKKSLSWMGIDMQRDGLLKFNNLTFLDAQAEGLQDILSQGVSVGYPSSINQGATASVNFKELKKNQSVTLNGLTFTASQDLVSADEVARAFAGRNINETFTNSSINGGKLNGRIMGWESGISKGSTVIFTSTTHMRKDKSLEASGNNPPTITFNTNDLNSYMDGLIGITGFSGSLADVLKSENNELSDLNVRQADLKDRLTVVQNNLINQYSALNALLYQLSQTNNALTSALSAISNNSKN